MQNEMEAAVGCSGLFLSYSVILEEGCASFKGRICESDVDREEATYHDSKPDYSNRRGLFFWLCGLADEAEREIFHNVDDGYHCGPCFSGLGVGRFRNLIR